MAESNYTESWEILFRELIEKHPEIQAGMATSIHNDLRNLSNKYVRWDIGKNEFQRKMISEVRDRVSAAGTCAMAVIRMREHDEFLMLHPVNDYCAGYTSENTYLDKAQIELENLLIELEQDDNAGRDVDALAQEEVVSASARVDQATEIAPAATDDRGSCEALTVAISSAKTCLSGSDQVAPNTTGYDYPDTDGEQQGFTGLSDRDLTAALDDLLMQRDDSGGLMPYRLIRHRYCALSEVMNQRGISPPRFRPKRTLPKLPAGAKHDPDDTLMMRDRQILDMHWLHCRGRRDLLPHPRYSRLFVGDELDFDLAADLATKAWSLNSKVFKVLNLIPYEEWQMAHFRSKDTDDAWRNTFTTMNTTIERRLREQAVKQPSLKPHIEDLKYLWAADKMADDLGQKTIGEVHGWLSGAAPLAASTLSAKLRRMKRRTAPKSTTK